MRMTEIYASGWGGRPNTDGLDGAMPVAMTGFRTNSGEAFEQELPVMLDGFGLVPDTGGPGRFRGSLSVFRRWRFLADGRVMLRTCRVDSLPCGVAGGGDGGASKAILTSNGKDTELPHNIMLDIPVKAGDRLMHMQPSAGGYGSALHRDPSLVLEDVLDGKLSASAAARDYAISVDVSSRTIDFARTAALRRAQTGRDPKEQ
jgi:N-methylhydantoinase B